MNDTHREARTLDGPALAGYLVAGIRHLFSRREYINRINVFPVPDSDTGTNMAFTFKGILDALEADPELPLSRLLERLTHAALDGARGNSGAIMAQFFQGCLEGAGNADTLDTKALGEACRVGARQAWTAMAKPVAGTLPTVLEDFAEGLAAAAQEADNICVVFRAGLAAARTSLANTPNQLPVLKQNGVVDAGGQGFVDLLDGIDAWADRGVLDPLDESFEDEAGDAAELPDTGALELGDHQFCTECVIEGRDLDRLAVMRRLAELDQSSMVVAGSDRRVRVHIHVNNPAEVFLACEAFGEITQQKADDMRWQQGLLNLQGTVAVVTDSGADLPDSEVERLGIHVVPVRVSFGDREFLDGVSLRPTEFYRMQQESDVPPKTSQPPPRDFRRVYELLTVHGYAVMHVGLSTLLSGTTQAAQAAAGRVEEGEVRVFDTLNASCGEGLLALAAAEAASRGMDPDGIERMLERLAPMTRTLAIVDELKSAVRGGRLPAWIGGLLTTLRLTPIIAARGGKITVAGVTLGRGADPATLARRVLKAMDPDRTFRVMVSHADNLEGAKEMRRLILAGHTRIHYCHLAEAGPALGAHMGRKGLVVAFMPDPQELSKP